MSLKRSACGSGNAGGQSNQEAPALHPRSAIKSPLLTFGLLGLMKLSDEPQDTPAAKKPHFETVFTAQPLQMESFNLTAGNLTRSFLNIDADQFLYDAWTAFLNANATCYDKHKQWSVLRPVNIIAYNRLFCKLGNDGKKLFSPTHGRASARMMRTLRDIAGFATAKNDLDLANAAYGLEFDYLMLLHATKPKFVKDFVPDCDQRWQFLLLTVAGATYHTSGSTVHAVPAVNRGLSNSANVTPPTASPSDPSYEKLIEQMRVEPSSNQLFPLEGLEVTQKYFNLLALYAKFNNPSALASSSVLLYGPPGTGKTQLVLHAAYASNIPMINVQCHVIRQRYVGEGEKIVAALFEYAKKHAPIVIFLDEVEGIMLNCVGGEQANMSGVQSMLLTKWSELASVPSVVVVGTTNEKDSMRAALLNRFSKRIYIGFPSQATIARILKASCAVLRHDLDDHDFEQVAKSVPPNSCGRDLMQVIQDMRLEKFGEMVYATAFAEITVGGSTRYEPCSPDNPHSILCDYNQFGRKDLIEMPKVTAAQLITTIQRELSRSEQTPINSTPSS